MLGNGNAKQRPKVKPWKTQGPNGGGGELGWYERRRCAYSYRFNASKLNFIAVQARIIEVTRHFDILALPMTPFFRDPETSRPLICIEQHALQYIS